MTRWEGSREFRRNRGAVLGLLVVGVLVAAAALAPVLAPYDPTLTDADRLLRAPGRVHLLGTDQFGRDVLSRILHGASASLQVGIIAVGIAASGGMLLGLLSGYYGRWIDLVVMRVIDVMLAFPSILLALAIVAVLGPGLNNVMLAVGIAGVPVYTRLVRGQVLATKALTWSRAAPAPERIVGRTSSRTSCRPSSSSPPSASREPSSPGRRFPSSAWAPSRRRPSGAPC
jgi:peptide/nickel transport system permease protein